MPNGWEWAILVIIALLLFGGARLSGVGRDVGRAVREFRQELTPSSSAKEGPVTTPPAITADQTTSADNHPASAASPTADHERS